MRQSLPDKSHKNVTTNCKDKMSLQVVFCLFPKWKMYTKYCFSNSNESSDFVTFV